MPQTRRRDDRHTRRARRQAAADRRIGHDLAYWYEARPLVLGALAVAAIGGGAWWLWANVEHRTIALTLGVLGVATLAGYAAWSVRTGSAHARTMAAATGRVRDRRWHLVGAAGACLVLAGLLLTRASS